MNNLRQFDCLTCALLFLLPFLGVGAGIFGVGVYQLNDSWQWMHSSVPATAVVEERHRHGSAEDEYEATVLFSPVEGEELSAMVVGTGLKPGTTVDIRYDPEKPTSARLQSWEQLWVGPAGPVLFGALFLAVSLPLMVAACVAAWRRQLWSPDEVPMERQDRSLADRAGGRS